MPHPLRRISALATFFGFIALAASGLVMLFLPGGSGQRGFGQAVAFLGVTRHDWKEFHEFAGIVFLVAALIHLAFNWRPMARHLGLGRPTGLVARRP